MNLKLIYAWLVMIPGSVAAQKSPIQPKPAASNEFVVVRQLKNGKTDRVLVGYDNLTDYQFFKVRSDSNQVIRAIERVIFLYTSGGLKVFSYIPKVSEKLDKSLLRGLSERVSEGAFQLGYTKNSLKTKGDENVVKRTEVAPVPKEEVTIVDKMQKDNKSVSSSDQKRVVSSTPIQLYYLSELSNSIKIRDSTRLIEIGDISTKERNDWIVATLDTERQDSIAYEDFEPISIRVMHTHFRAVARRKWYAEFGGLVGTSYRTIQVINPLPNRAIYEPRLTEDAAQFSWLASVRGGYNLNRSHSLFVGALYVHQSLLSSGQIDWKSGLVLEKAGRSKNIFDFWGSELGYSYSSFQKKFGISVDVGINFLWTKNLNEVQKFTWGPQFGIGPKIRIGALADIRIMPTLCYNIRSIEKNKANDPGRELATRMFTTGVKVSLRWD